MTEPVADDERRMLSSFKWRNRLLLLPILIIGGGGCWFGFPELQRRFGLEQTAAINLAATMAMVPAVLLVWLIARLTGWRKQSPTRRVLWIMEEKTLAFQRRWRPWMVFYTILVAVPYLLELALPATGARASPADWSLLALVVFCWPLIMPMAKTGPLLDERLRSERSEAIRMGYMVVIMLGVIAAVCVNYWPNFVARCWPLIIILGVLVPQVRLTVMDYHVISKATDDT